MKLLFSVLSLGVVSCSPVEPPPQQVNTCADCHVERSAGFNEAHAFAADDCTICHGGDPGASEAAAAHEGLVAFPGNMKNAKQACGACHADRVASVTGSLMNTAARK